MGEKFIPIADVIPTYDPTKIVKLYNPFTKIFKHAFDGKEVQVKAGLSDHTEPLAHFLAKHIATEELVPPAVKAELEERHKPMNERSWEHVQELSKGVAPAVINKRAAELVLDPTNKKDAKKIKELEAA